MGTKTAVGVEVTKVVGNRQLRKRLHVRIEHVRKSRCNEHFLKRVKENDVIKQEAKKRGEKASVKRVPPGPKPGKIVNAKEGVHVLERSRSWRTTSERLRMWTGQSP